MKRMFICALLQMLVLSIFGQSHVILEKENLGTIDIGDGQNQIRYVVTEEGFFSPGGIYSDTDGYLFLIQNFRSKPILRFKDGKFFQTPVPQNVPSTWFGPASYGVSQNGICGEGSFFFSLSSDNLYKQTDFFDRAYMKPAIARWYPIPKGVVWESADGKQLVSAEFTVGTLYKLRTLKETRDWLMTQQGSYTIGDEGFLYRNGIRWSAMKPKVKEQYDWRYLGRLASGHIIWCPGPPEVANTFTIVDAQGNIELTAEVPVQSRFNYGLGPWGELYYLFAPPMDKRLDPLNDFYKPEPGIAAELVVFRNHLKYFGRLNDSNVRLRKEPNTTSEVLGTFPNKTGFRILEKGTKEETIGGQKNVWYKVRLLDGKEGWFFGSFVHNLYDGPNGNPPPWPNVPDW